MNAMTPINPSVASGSTEVSTFDFSYGIEGRGGPAGRSAIFPVRIVQINGEPWFVAADVCKALDLPLEGGASRYLQNVNADEKMKKGRSDYPELFVGVRAPTYMLISESGLYKLVMRSDKPQAKKFQDWVTRDVLPTIRKTGQYNVHAAKVAKGEMSFAEMTAKVMQGLLEQVELAPNHERYDPNQSRLWFSYDVLKGDR